jgi:hypothetical protein
MRFLISSVIDRLGRGGQRAVEREPMMLLINDPRQPGRFLAARDRVWIRASARLLARSLDEQLAGGRLPESSRLLASRAQQLVSPALRTTLVHSWERLIDAPRSAPVARSPKVPLCRRRLAAAEPEVREMLSVLSSPIPTSVRGLAMANLLLEDGAGPLFNRQCHLDLGAVVRRATEQLDPMVGFAS